LNSKAGGKKNIKQALNNGPDAKNSNALTRDHDEHIINRHESSSRQVLGVNSHKRLELFAVN
jgi:hypothetical protein